MSNRVPNGQPNFRCFKSTHGEHREEKDKQQLPGTTPGSSRKARPMLLTSLYNYFHDFCQVNNQRRVKNLHKNSSRRNPGRAGEGEGRFSRITRKYTSIAVQQRGCYLIPGHAVHLAEHILEGRPRRFEKGRHIRFAVQPVDRNGSGTLVMRNGKLTISSVRQRRRRHATLTHRSSCTQAAVYIRGKPLPPTTDRAHTYADNVFCRRSTLFPDMLHL